MPTGQDRGGWRAAPSFHRGGPLAGVLRDGACSAAGADDGDSTTPTTVCTTCVEWMAATDTQGVSGRGERTDVSGASDRPGAHVPRPAQPRIRGRPGDRPLYTGDTREIRTWAPLSGQTSPDPVDTQTGRWRTGAVAGAGRRDATGLCGGPGRPVAPRPVRVLCRTGLADKDVGGTRHPGHTRMPGAGWPVGRHHADLRLSDADAGPPGRAGHHPAPVRPLAGPPAAGRPRRRTQHPVLRGDHPSASPRLARRHRCVRGSRRLAGADPRSHRALAGTAVHHE